MSLQHIDLSERHGHRDDHGFACGAEFNVKIRRRLAIPDFVREQLSEGQIDEAWWEEAQRSRESLRDELQRRYKWIGELSFVGRGPGWLAIEDTGCKTRNWDTIGKIVEKRLKEFVASMENPAFWTDVKGVDHATKRAAGSRKIRVGDEVRFLGGYGGRYVVLSIKGPRAVISSLNGKGHTETASTDDLWKL